MKNSTFHLSYGQNCFADLHSFIYIDHLTDPRINLTDALKSRKFTPHLVRISSPGGSDRSFCRSTLAIIFIYGRSIWIFLHILWKLESFRNRYSLISVATVTFSVTTMLLSEFKYSFYRRGNNNIRLCCISVDVISLIASSISRFRKSPYNEWTIDRLSNQSNRETFKIEALKTNKFIVNFADLRRSA